MPEISTTKKYLSMMSESDIVSISMFVVFLEQEIDFYHQVCFVAVEHVGNLPLMPSKCFQIKRSDIADKRPKFSFRNIFMLLLKSISALGIKTF